MLYGVASRDDVALSISRTFSRQLLWIFLRHPVVFAYVMRNWPLQMPPFWPHFGVSVARERAVRHLFAIRKCQCPLKARKTIWHFRY